MNTLSEIEVAIVALPPEEKRTLIRFLQESLKPAPKRSPRAKLVPGPNGTLLLEASPGTAPMTTARVKQMLEDFP